jgi:hypothetical protein
LAIPLAIFELTIVPPPVRIRYRPMAISLAASTDEYEQRCDEHRSKGNGQLFNRLTASRRPVFADVNVAFSDMNSCFRLLANFADGWLAVFLWHIRGLTPAISYRSRNGI